MLVLKVKLVSKVNPSVASQRASFLMFVEGADPSPVRVPLPSIVDIREPKTLPVVTLLLYNVPPVEARFAAVATPVPSMVEMRVLRFPEVLYMPVVLESIFAPLMGV